MPENVGDIEYVIKADTAQLLRADKQVRDITDGMEGGFNRADKAASSLTSSFGSLSRVATSLMAILSVQQVAQYADAWTTLNNKLANALRPGERLVDVTERVFNITQQTRGSLDATASLYARLERATREYGTSADDLAKLTTIINQGFVVSGATAQEAENAIIQLSQGLASGALRGEEFNSVNEQGNRLIVALADSMGVGIGQMRQMAAAGKLTTDVVVNGLLSQGVTIGNEFANTTTTISQALQVAGNNITKFFGENSTVKTGTAIFNDAVISVSENIGALGAILTATAAVMGSRYVGALTMATSKKIDDIAASRQQLVAERQAAQAALFAANSVQRKALADKEAALSSLALAQAEYNVAKGSTAEMLAMDALVAAKSRASTASLALAEAENTQAAASTRAAAAARAASVGVSAAGKALSLVGGPAGFAMLAATAVYYLYQKVQQAKQESIDFADSLDGLTAKMKEMSSVQIASAIAKTEQSIIDQQDAIASLRAEYEQLEQKKTFIEQAAQIRWTAAVADDLAEANRNLAVQADKVEQAENKLSRTTSSLGLLRAQANGQFREGIDLLRRDGEEAGVAAGMMGNLGDMINFAAKAKEKFNSSSLMVERPKDVQDYLDKLQDQVTLQSELNDRKRAQLKAEQDIRKLGGTEADVRLARERAAAEYDAQQAQQKGKKEAKDATSEATRYANQQEVIAQKLTNLKQQSELAARSTSELSREQAVIAAQQSLGKGATQEQIALAGKYRGEIWDTANALKAQAAAEKLLPEARENASYKQDVQDLKTALDAKKISQQQYNQTSEVLEQQHQANLAKIRSQQVVSPMQSAVAEVDPVQQLANQHAQQLALIQQFEQQGVIAHDNALALKNAADTEYEQARIAAQWEIFRNQSQANELLASSLEGLQSGATNALTGLISGTQSLQEAFANIGTTILNSVVGSLVQMGIEWVKSQLMGQAAAAASLASTMAQATAAASAWAPAAMSASIATMGSAAAVGQTAYAGSLLAAKGMAVAGARYNGGPVDAGSMYRVGEHGKPEIFQASNGSQYMIPGDNGRVISNRDMHGSGSGGSSVVQHITFEINTTGGIDDATKAWIVKSMKQVALFQINDQANRPNGMIQPRNKR
ncbi:tape measure protein [Salmonella enterica subsp. enterica serovar Montevideo]|uniref:tape measure protein n=1 Tax=Salmonella enterica TaxID=28901 RepID=UPI0009ABE5CC|nr:tape measure protein [Salmonella enterica]ECL8982258.1 tape measure protein [Salmonella enterica subsp. enterica serovar Montevideo]EDZ2500557.1 tape measure protein [Salmonella enterica subsp. enterica]EDY9829676.1 tape measure protein [Salmonella enterica subsp. enterica serovar Montevideo]EHL3766965.1 tape measure protein [Salmonella enterica subsp. enterica serovar Montevideo]EIJ1761686.1 tape measure protein [Salmonella enterica subsp. enterica serovar Montevideo]